MERIAKDHPIQPVKVLADAALAELSMAFYRMYSGVGRPSIPPERLLKSMLPMALYSVRSERIRKRIEEIFGWSKTTGGFRCTRFKGIARTQLAAHLVGALELPTTSSG